MNTSIGMMMFTSKVSRDCFRLMMSLMWMRIWNAMIVRIVYSELSIGQPDPASGVLFTAKIIVNRMIASMRA